MDLFTKCYKDTRAEEVQKAGLYPYFHPISSALGTEVVMDGKKVIGVFTTVDALKALEKALRSSETSA